MSVTTLQDSAEIDSREQRELSGGLKALPFLILSAASFLIPAPVVLLVAYLGWGADALPREPP